MKRLVKHIFQGTCLAVLCLAIPSRAELQPDMKLTAAGIGRGNAQVIDGELAQKGKERLWAVNAYNLEIQQPTDAATGLATGKKVFRPVSVVVAAGSIQTPALHSLFASNRTLTTVEIRFWQPSNSGLEVHYVTVRLTNAKILALREWVANIKDPEFLKYPQQHQVEFTYEKIEWMTTVNGGGTVVDGPNPAAQ